MGITYNDAIKAQEELEEKILDDPNVVSIGVVAETNDLGEPTGDYAIQVGVISIDTCLRAQERGQSAIPKEVLYRSQNALEEDKHIHVNLVREGKIEALASLPKTEKDYIPSAIDDLPENFELSSGHAYTIRRRPSPCGQSIGHPDITAGTLGLLVKYTEGPNEGKAYILSNNHVIASNNLASVGDAVIQPGKYDSGVAGKDTIALLHRWVPLKNSGFNYVDAAIAEVRGSNRWQQYVTPYISDIGFPGNVAEPNIGMLVEKVGRTTGYTQGKIVSNRFTTKITYPMGTLNFRNQIRTTSMSKPGDSGSCLVEQKTKKTVGLLFAGSDLASYFNPINAVLSNLSMEHVNRYPSGRTHKFSTDYPLTIIQKKPYFTLISTKKTPSAFARIKKALPKKYSLAVTAAGMLFCNKINKPTRPINRKISSELKCSFFKTTPKKNKVDTNPMKLISKHFNL